MIASRTREQQGLQKFAQVWPPIDSPQPNRFLSAAIFFNLSIFSFVHLESGRAKGFSNFFRTGHVLGQVYAF